MLRRILLVIPLLLVAACGSGSPPVRTLPPAPDAAVIAVSGVRAVVQTVADYTRERCDPDNHPCDRVRMTADLAIPVLDEALELMGGPSRCDAIKSAIGAASKIVDAIDAAVDSFHLPNYLTGFLRGFLEFVPCPTAEAGGDA